MVASCIRPSLYDADVLYSWIEEVCSQESWPEYTRALQARLRGSQVEATPRLPVYLLPGLCCQAAGGDPKHSIGVAAAWVLLYSAAHILDDVEDGDLVNDLAQEINAATGLIFAGLRALVRSKEAVGADQALQIIEDFARTILEMCGGQHEDLRQFIPSLEQCWRIVEAKSGAWFSLASRSGALLAGIAPQLVEHYSTFGRHLGVLIQISDDLQGMWPKKENRSDLAHKRTLPVIYVLTVAPAQIREELSQCLEAVAQDPSAETRARALIREMGAPLYLHVEAQRHFREAEAALRAADPLPEPKDRLLNLLERAMPFRAPQ